MDDHCRFIQKFTGSRRRHFIVTYHPEDILAIDLHWIDLIYSILLIHIFQLLD